jgi:hypothetical protein
MQSLFDIVRPLLAVIVGIAVGISFGLIQRAAWRRHQEKERKGEFKNAWGVMPGSGARVAYLLIALVIIQIICPMLFANGTQWWVSGGVVAGYGGVLFRQLRERKATNL